MSGADGSDIRELPAGESGLAHEAMSALRPAWADRERFAAQVDEVLRPGGYRLVGSFAPGTAQAVAAAGFRLAHSLAWGRHLYLDDLSTVTTARRRGHAAALLDWVLAEAARLGCGQVHLDSGTGPDRFAAHRLYHRTGFAISSHHFGIAVDAERGPAARSGSA